MHPGVTACRGVRVSMHLHSGLPGPTSSGCIKVSFLETAMIAFMSTLALLLMVSWRIPLAK